MLTQKSLREIKRLSDNWQIHMKRGETENATRQPAILYVFDMVYISTPISFAPDVCKKLLGFLPSKPMAPYAKSCTTHISYFLASSTVCSKNASVAVAAVGLLGYFRNIRLASSRMDSDRCLYSGHKSFSC